MKTAEALGRILIVDDTPENLAVLTQVLRGEGYEVLSVLSGKRALQAARREAPDLLLLDIQMPEMDGYETCRQFKADETLAAIPIIFISAATDADVKVRAFTSGGVDFVSKPFEHQEVLARVRTHLALRSAERDLERRLLQKEQEVLHMAYHDALTGLPNRLQLFNRLEYALEVAAREGRQLAVLSLDIDRFKIVNDSLGHEVGDQLLMTVAQRLRDTAQRSDIVCRIGGDEFALALTDVDTAVFAAHIAEELLPCVAETITVGEHAIRISPSIGIAIFPQDGADAHTLLRNADAALRRVKDSGGNGFRFFDQTMNKAATERLDLETALRLAVDRQEFVVHYQPQLRLSDRAVLVCEALIRWHHPKRGLVPPLEFIPLAEETGLIVPIGIWVLRAACRQVQSWRAAGLGDLSVAVNLSARQFHQPDLVTQIRAAVAETGLPPRALEIELTESTVMDDAERAVGILRELREIGIRISVDDFGTGYSSLSYRRTLPINSLKIDRSFISDIGVDADDDAIVQTIIALGKVLRLEEIAEGIETEAQAEFLNRHGCDIGQGYLFARPMPAEAFADWLRGREKSRFPKAPGLWSVQGEALVAEGKANVLPLQPEIGAAHPVVLEQSVAGAAQHHGAGFDDIGAVGHRQRRVGVLLDQQNRRALALQLGDRLIDLAHQHRRQPHARLIEQQQARMGHQGAGQSEHLLLTAGKMAGGLMAAGLEHRKQLHHAHDVGVHAVAAPAIGAEPQIVLDAERGEDLPALGHLDDAEPDPFIGREGADVGAPEGQRAAAHPLHPRDGAQQRALAGAVGADQGDGLALADLEGDPGQRLDAAIMAGQIDDVEHAPSPQAAPR